MRKKSSFELVKLEPHKATFDEIVIIFALASIVGYFIETIYVYLVCGNFVKRGMLTGPYCPIYGFGTIILYLSFYKVKRTKENIPLIFLFTSLLMGAFELMCGLGFKYFFNMEMWNYSGKFLNILNYTTVPILIGWGILGTIYVFFLHPLILKVLSVIPKHIMRSLAIIIICIYIIDNIVSTKRIHVEPQILDNLVHPEQIESILKEEPNFVSSSSFYFLNL